MSEQNELTLKLEYDLEFQEKIISSILTDASYAKKVLPILKYNYLDSDSLQWVLKLINGYYEKYKNIPNISFLANELNKEENEQFKTQVKKSILSIKEYYTAPDLQYIKDDTLKFCVNANMTLALWKSADLLEEKKFEEIFNIIGKAMVAGNINDDDVDYKEDIHNRYKEDKLSSIPTRWKHVNDKIKGGLPSGSLTMFIGASGRGKSWLLCDIGQYASMNGYRVAHYTLELSTDYVGRRYDIITTTLEDSEIEAIMRLPDEDENKIQFINTIQSIKGNIDLTYYSPGQATIAMIRSNIETKIQKNIKPNIVILDYPDLLTSNGEAVNLDAIYKGCKAIATDYDIPVVIVTQSNREGMKSDVIKEYHVKEHIGKIDICDIVFSWNRNEEEEEVGRLWNIKNRFGKDKFLVDFDFVLENGLINSTGEADINNETTKLNNLKRNARTTFNDKIKHSARY